MNKVKSLLNETKSFPPYYNMIDSLNMNLEGEKKIVEGLSLFLEQDLSILYENNPKELQPVIRLIQKAGKKQLEIMQNMISTESTIPNTMTQLHSLYTEIKNELQIISNARDLATNSQLIMDRSIQNLNKLKKQNIIDQLKLEEANQQVDKATKQYESDAQNADNVQKERSQNIINLRKKFVESLAISLKSLSQMREAYTKDIYQVSSELENTLLVLDQSDEPNFSALEDRLKQLNEEAIE